jgi:hypothetical protein
MGRRSGSEDLVALLDEILTDASGDAEQSWALLQALSDNVAVPCLGTVVGEPVQVIRFDYDGNVRRGLTARIRRADGSEHVIGAADVVLDDGAGQRYIAAYRQWMAAGPRARKSKPSVRAAIGTGSVELVILSVSALAARCRIFASGEEITLRSGRIWTVVPGQIATIRPTKQWTYGGKPYLSGKIESTRLDAKALGLTPLLLRPFGEWDPAEEFWGDPGEPIGAWARKIIKRGRRPRFEMEQVLPGEDPNDMWSDPISMSNDKLETGDAVAAREILMKACRADLRCLDAHAHLGNLSFEGLPEEAIRHYEVGVRIGELSLGADFEGVLPWGMIDNRPFLRCLHGYGLCLWRLKRFKESAAVFDRMLWMNPTDNQGVRLVIDEVRKGRTWRPEE